MRISSVRWERFDKRPILTCTNSVFRTASSQKYTHNLHIDRSYFSPVFDWTFKYSRKIISKRAYHPLYFPLFNNAPPSSLYEPNVCSNGKRVPIFGAIWLIHIIYTRHRHLVHRNVSRLTVVRDSAETQRIDVN